MAWHVTAEIELARASQRLDLAEAFVTSLRSRVGEDLAGFRIAVGSALDSRRTFVEEIRVPADGDVLALARNLAAEHLEAAEDRALHLAVDLRPAPGWDARPSNDLVVHGRSSAVPRDTWRARSHAYLELGRAGIYTHKRPTRTLSGVALDRPFLIGLFTELCDWVEPETLQVLDQSESGVPANHHLVYHRDPARFVADLRQNARADAEKVEAVLVAAEGVELLSVRSGVGVLGVPFLEGTVANAYAALEVALS